MPKKIMLLALAATLVACRRDNVRAVDATPEVPSSIDFGLLAVKQEKVVPITIANSGTVALSVTELKVKEPFNVELPPDAVQAGASGDVLIKFQPVQPGDVDGDLILITNSTELPEVHIALHGTAFIPHYGVSPDRLDFGDVNVGEQKTLTFTTTNQSPVALNPDVEPKDPGSDFAVSPQGFLGDLDANQSATVTVSFAPSVAGPANSSVLIDCAVCSTLEVQLTGNGVGAPPPPPSDAGTDTDAGTPDAGPVEECTLSADPAEVDLGKLAPGETSRQTVSLNSVGTGPCFLQTPYLASGTDPSFSASPLHAGTLQPGDSTQITVTYAPVATTPLQVSGALVVVSNDKASSPLNVPLTGQLDPPPPPPPPPPPGHLVVAPLSLSFTAQVPNAPGAQTLALLNDGGQNLSWTGTSDDAKMTLSRTSGTLVPGGTASITVSVAAQTTAGTRTQSIVIDAGSAGKVTVPVTITFTAAPPPPPPPAKLTVTPLTLHFTAQAGTAPPPQSITVGNSGGTSLTWNGSVDDTGVTFAATSGTLAGGAAQIVQVSVAASQFSGSRTANLTIDAAAAGKATVVITIDFTEPPPPPPPPVYGGSAWPKWHHDNASSGLSHIDTSANKGTVRWKAHVSDPVPCVTDGRTNNFTRCGTYVNSPVLDGDGNIVQLGGDGFLYEFLAATGRQKWKVQTAPPWIAANEGTPTVVKDGSIFLMTAGESHTKAQWYKISKDGVVVSQNTPGGDCNGITCDGWDSSPALDDDGNLYEANDDYGTIQVFDQNRTLQREIALDPKSDIETQSAALADGIGYWSANGHLWALGASKQLWSFTDPIAATHNDWRPAGSFHNIKSSPTLTPDGKVVFTYVYETTKDNVLMQTTRIYAYAAGTKLKQLWMVLLGPNPPKTGLPPGPGQPSSYADSTHYRSGITSPAVGPDGTIYVGHCDGLYALHPDTGRFKWGVGMSEVVGSPAVGKDGTIYAGSMDGHLYAIAPDGSVKWQVATKGQLNSSPAIGADGTVYAMSDDGYLYAVH